MNKKTEFIPRPKRTVEEKRAYRLQKYHEGRKAIKKLAIAIVGLETCSSLCGTESDVYYFAKEALKQIEEMG